MNNFNSALILFVDFELLKINADKLRESKINKVITWDFSRTGDLQNGRLHYHLNGQYLYHLNGQYL